MRNKEFLTVSHLHPGPPLPPPPTPFESLEVFGLQAEGVFSAEVANGSKRETQRVTLGRRELEEERAWWCGTGRNGPPFVSSHSLS